MPARSFRRRSRPQLKAINKRLSTLSDAVQPEAARRRQGRRAARHRQGGARRPFGRADRRGGGSREGPQARGLCPAAAEHDAAAGARIADQPRHAPEAVRGQPQPRRTWRRQRHARDRQRDCAAAREEGGAVRLRELAPTTRSTTRWRRTARRRSASSTASRRRSPPRSGRNGADIRALAKSQGATFQPTAADWNFYAEQIRKQRYALNSDELKPYFEFNKVLEDGVFYAANQLYGLTFKERKDIPTWNPDMRVFEVYDAGRQAAGDLHDRPVEARQQVGRRVDVEPRQPVVPARHQAGRLQRRELHQARAAASRR